MSDREAEVAARLDRLRRWRDGAAAARQQGVDAIRDIHLTMVARSGRRAPEAIAEVLPASLKPFAGALAAALAASGPAPAPHQPPPGATTLRPGGPPAGRYGGPAGGPPPGAYGAPGRPGPTPPVGYGPPPGSGPGGRPATSYPSAPVPPGPAAPPSSGVTAPPRSAASASASLPPRSVPPDPNPPVTNPTAPAPETPEQRQARLAVEWERFAPIDHSEPPGEPGRIQAAAATGGGVRLRWEPWSDDGSAGADAVTLYRVCSRDDFAPYDPHDAEYVEVTERTGCVDERPFTSAVRHLQVWRNSGSSIDDAHAHQPVLHAQVPLVAPVIEVDLREDEGRVIGQWQTFDGIKRVQVHRVPAERAHAGIGDPEYRILADEDNLGGFVDDEVERGRRYVYQFSCEAELDGVIRLSAVTTRQLMVSAVLEPVTDLAVTIDHDPDSPQFDLTWTSPRAGRVIIFRTEGGPRAGAGAEVRPESVLEQMNLPDSARLAHPIVRDQARAAMRNVPWPRGWVRIYFTAVTVLDGRVQVGATVPAVRTMGVTDPVVVERTHTQVLKFGWPTGAAEVSVMLGARGQPASELITTAQRIDISAKDYERFGGMQFARPLPSTGCSLHLVGVAYSAGRRIESTPVSLDYPGLLRLNYQVVPRRGLMGRAPLTLALRIAAEVDLTHAPPFVLLYNRERFPLEIGDGDPLEMTVDGQQAAVGVRRFVPAGLGPQWSAQTWLAQPPGPGFVRLFLDLPPDRLQTIALLDPDIDSLIVRS